MNLERYVGFFALCFLPALLAMGFIILLHRRQTRGIRVPVKEKLLRAPGETLRKRLEDLDERAMNWVLLLAGAGPLSIAGTAMSQAEGRPIFSGPNFVVIVSFVVAITLFAGWRLWAVLQTRRNISLGYRGECFVGEELNQLMRDGCYVFHDFPGAGEWNLDHVVVAPTGVFVVETKTRRKGNCPKGRKDYEVFFDGRTLDYPHCKDAYGLEQAKVNAKWLSQHLGSALARNVWVSPILTLPGWMVTTRAKPLSGDVQALNPKQIRTAILNSTASRLDSREMQQIAHQLEQRCRDVEF